MNAGHTYLGLDIGGTGAKAGVFDPAGVCLGLARCRYRHVTTGAHRAELDILCVEEAARRAVGEAVRSAGVSVDALAVSSQGQTFVALDAGGEPLSPAILWYDTRAAGEAGELNQRLAERRDLPALSPVKDIATVAKIRWLHKHCPATREPTTRFLLLPDYVACRLTGRAVTDPNTASSTGLCAADGLSYSRPVLEAAGLDERQLSPIRPAGAVVGRVLPEPAARWGLTPDTRLVVGANDQYAGALGAGNCAPGILSVTLGTCLALVTLTPHRPSSLPPGLFSGAFPLRPYHFLLAFSKTAGLVLDWFQRELAPGMSLDELSDLAAGSPPGSRGLTVLPHFDGSISPHTNPDARGMVYGLCLQHSRSDIYRAMLESLAFSLRENCEMMEASGYPISTVRSIGGGAGCDLWMQMQADVLGRPVERPACTEAAVLGAAMMAAWGADDFRSLHDACTAMYTTGQVHHPDPVRCGCYDPAYAAYRRLDRVLHGR